MANLCRQGLGVVVDMEQADKLEKKAFNIWDERASAGDAEAMFEIGVCYRRGEGVPQDDAKAVEYTLMSRQHYYGLGRDVNYEKAVEVLQSNGFPYPLEEESEL